MPLRGEARHEPGEIKQVRDPKQRPSLPHNDFSIRGDHVGPLRRNRADRAIIDTQQNPLARPVTALADADKLPTAEWMEGMGYADKPR